MKNYKTISHVADVRLQIEGTTLEELFNAALEGMASIIVSNYCAPPFKKSTQITITSSDTTTLLIDFLSEVLTQTHLETTIYCKAEFTQLTPTNLIATISGNKADSFEEDIKGVTYHEADVKKNEAGNFSTIIIFDI